jgi:hypothetical protein
MNVEIGAEAAQFPEKEYINGIAVAVYVWQCSAFPLWTYSMLYINLLALIKYPAIEKSKGPVFLAFY